MVVVYRVFAPVLRECIVGRVVAGVGRGGAVDERRCCGMGFGGRCRY